MLYKSELLTLETIGYSWNYLDGYWFMGSSGLLYSCIYLWMLIGISLYSGRVPHTKETLPDFREKCRVTRYSRVFSRVDG